MKIKTIFAISMILLLILVISGCDEEVSNTSPGDAFLGGQAGLKVEFQKGMPPPEVLDDNKQRFGIAVKLHNIGESDVIANGGYVEIVGINAKQFGKNNQDDLKKEIDDELKGAKKSLRGGERIDGGQTIVEFSDLKYKPDLPGDNKFNIVADVCYNYKTTSVVNVCVKKDLLKDLSDEKICQVTGDKDVQNSGGPIHITKVSQNPIGDSKIQLLFTIAHVGDPEDSFFKRGTDCDDSTVNDDRYRVYFKILSDIDGAKPQCNRLETASGDNVDRSEGYITLYDREEQPMSCTIDLSGVSSKAFETVLKLEMEYRYLQSLGKELIVKDVS